jgi:hypothetical protein
MFVLTVLANKIFSLDYTYVKSSNKTNLKIIFSLKQLPSVVMLV